MKKEGHNSEETKMKISKSLIGNKRGIGNHNKNEKNQTKIIMEMKKNY